MKKSILLVAGLLFLSAEALAGDVHWLASGTLPLASSDTTCARNPSDHTSGTTVSGMEISMDCDPDSTEGFIMPFVTPGDWPADTATYTLLLEWDGGAANDIVIRQQLCCETSSLNDDDPVCGTESSATCTLSNAPGAYTECSHLTADIPAGCTSHDFAYVIVNRNGGSGSDTLTSDSRFRRGKLTY